MTAPLDLDTLELLADIQADLRSGIARRRLRMELLDAKAIVREHVARQIKNWDIRAIAMSEINRIRAEIRKAVRK